MYFKINSKIWKIIEAAGLSALFVSCSPLCDRQLISTPSIMECVRQIKQLNSTLEKKLAIQAETYPEADPNKPFSDEEKKQLASK